MVTLKLLTMAATCMFNIFFVCHGASLVTNESQNVFDALYDLNWYDETIKQRQDLLMIMMRTRSIRHLRAVVFDMSLEMFLKVRRL